MRAVQLEEEEVAAVEHELGRAGADVADRARERGSPRRSCARAARGRARATAPPRAPSGGGAGSSTRARRARAPCRARRRAAGSRRAAAARGSARRARGRRRTPPSPRAAPPRPRRRAPPPSARRRMPRPPPPAAALTSSGKPSSSGSPSGTTGTPASRAIRFASSLSPPARSASGGGPTQASPAASTAVGEVGALGEEAVARDGSRRRRSRCAARMCSSESRYEAISTVSSAERACSEPASSGAATATVAMPELAAPCGRRAARSRRGSLRGASGSATARQA